MDRTPEYWKGEADRWCAAFERELEARGELGRLLSAERRAREAADAKLAAAEAERDEALRDLERAKRAVARLEERVAEAREVTC